MNRSHSKESDKRDGNFTHQFWRVPARPGLDREDLCGLGVWANVWLQVSEFRNRTNRPRC